MTWREDAACVDIDPEVFFPQVAVGRGYVTKRASVQALSLCAGCGVTTQCLEYALSMPLTQDFGIWGGTTATQRVKMRMASKQHQPLPSRTRPLQTKSLQEAASISL